MKRFIVFIVFGIMYQIVFATTEIDSLMSSLKTEVSNRESYLNIKFQKLDSLKALAAIFGDNDNASSKFINCQNLYNEYRSFNYDSAFTYARKVQKIAYELNDESKIAKSKINFGFILISSGMFKEAFDTLNTLGSIDIPDSLLMLYYPLMSRAYLDIMSYGGLSFFSPTYEYLQQAYLDSTVSIYNKNTKYYLYYTGLQQIANKNMRLAQETFEDLLNQKNLDYHLFAMTASSLSYVYYCSGKKEDAISLLFEAVKADIKYSTKETLATYKLAELLYDEGYAKEAYFVIQLAMDDALFYNSNLRKQQISSIMPTISGKELSTTQTQKKHLFGYSVINTSLSVLVVIFLFITIRQLKQLKLAKRNITAINEKLYESNKIKDECVGYYFNSNSEYIDKIEKFKRTISRKLTAKKYIDIEDIINNLNPHKEKEELYIGFDRVFLKLFPDFIEQFNALLKEEERIFIKENQPLTSEMRIFALMRIGIDDHEKISKILGYSVSTIYNYKSKIRKKAIIPHGKFEEEIMKIKSI